MQVSNFLNPMENKVFQFSFYDFVKTSLTKHFTVVNRVLFFDRSNVKLEGLNLVITTILHPSLEV